MQDSQKSNHEEVLSQPKVAQKKGGRLDLATKLKKVKEKEPSQSEAEASQRVEPEEASVKQSQKQTSVGLEKKNMLSLKRKITSKLAGTSGGLTNSLKRRKMN